MTSSKPLPWPLTLILFTIGLLECGYLINELARPLLAKPDPVYVWEPVTDPRFIIPPKYRQWVIQYAAEFGIPLDIATRLAFEESSWRSTAMHRNRNKTYDHGLYQLNSRYHFVMLTQANIYEGLRYFKWCWKKMGTLRKAAIAYNAGWRNVNRAPQSSIDFADRVVGGQL